MFSRKRSVLIIGVGRFGRYLALKFIELRNEIMIVDKSEDAMADLIPLVTNAQIGDCTKLEVLHSLGASNFDICFVCIGSNFQTSIEITSQLKDLGAKYVVAKADRELHEKFLLRNGADEVIFPEKESANKAAIRLSSQNIMDYIELTPEHYILEIAPLDRWIGKTIAEVGVRDRYGINILAIRKDNKVDQFPSAKHIFMEGEQLIVVMDKPNFYSLLKKK
ncbi:MAG: potassium channel family protein [Natronincolaceae bacterium]|jgi:trk system potassium uptake protein TrkA|nr:TrkA family potassium uptake protein [Bacillota bacterium]NLK91245.1 TrkA family potassium uptake protein [Clostridiales bacterium]